MTGRTALRALLGLLAAGILLLVLLPRTLPRPAGDADPAREMTDLVGFGLRVMATALAGYVAVVLLALLLGSLRLLPATGRRWLDRWTERGVAAAIRRAVGASALALGLVPLAPAGATASTPPVLTAVDPPTARASPSPRPVEPRLEPPPPVAPASGPPTVTVGPGDSFWSLARDLATLFLGRHPTDAEVVPGWSALIDANRDRLIDLTDPDLLLPGQVLRLPAPPPPRAGR